MARSAGQFRVFATRQARLVNNDLTATVTPPQYLRHYPRQRLARHNTRFDMSGGSLYSAALLRRAPLRPGLVTMDRATASNGPDPAGTLSRIPPAYS